MQSLVTERTASAHNRLDMLADVLRQSREVDRSSVEQEADAIGEQLCKLSKFIVLNTTGFRKICKKVRRLAPTPVHKAAASSALLLC